jgi:large subunit ribosomal protein L25
MRIAAKRSRCAVNFTFAPNGYSHERRRDMGDKINLKLTKRDVHGKKVAKLRREGVVPGVVYGPGMEPVSVQAEYNVIAKTYRDAGTHTPIHLDIEGKKRIALIKEIEVNPVKNAFNHVSFHAVKANEPVIALVPVRLVGEGESEAEKAGLIVLQALDEIEVRALPMELPEAIEVSIAELKEAGEKVTLADAKLPEGVEFVERETGREEELEEGEERPTILDTMVASVWEPAALQAQNEAAAGDAEDASAEDVEAENGSEEAPAEGEEKKEA